MKVTPEITKEMLQKYIGGQFEWYDLIDNSCIFAGIKEIGLDDDHILLNFRWAVDVLNTEDTEERIQLLQNFNYSQYTIDSSDGEIKQKEFIDTESEDTTVYRVIEILNRDFLYRIRLYPPGSLGLQIEQLEERGIKIPN